MSTTEGKWSKETPTEQGWFWYRKNNRYHAVPTFVENCGEGRFRAVEVYQDKMIWATDTDVEWWSEKIYQPE